MTPRVKASGWNNACGAHTLDPSSVGSAAGEKQKRGERESQSHQHRNIELQKHDSFSQKQSDTCTTKQGLDLSPLWILRVKLRPLQMSTSKVTCRNSEWVCPDIIFCQLWGRVIEATNNTVVYRWLMYDQEVNTFESYLHMKYGMCVQSMCSDWITSIVDAALEKQITSYWVTNQSVLRTTASQFLQHPLDLVGPLMQQQFVHFSISETGEIH